MLNRARSVVRGVSLVEALVALAVMAFGVLGVVGIQMTLRANGDVAKQRAEAVRIAQEALENWRGFTALSSNPALPAGHTMAYDMVASSGSASTVTVPDSNTSYTLKMTAVTPTAPASLPSGWPASVPTVKTMQARVEWIDRSGATQFVELTSQLAGIVPEVAGSLAIPSRALQNKQVGNRHSAIPVSATDIGGGQSLFTPPQASGTVAWVFSNTTGLITSVCNPYPSSCVATDAALLAGYIVYAGSPSTGSWSYEGVLDALPAAVFGARLTLTIYDPVPSAWNCFYNTSRPAYLAYFCAVGRSTASKPVWSGRSLINTATLAIGAATSVSASDYRVCRYTRDPLTDTPTIAGSSPTLTDNAAHPLDYNAVGQSLTNQNFVVIPAGNGSAAHTCPVDDGSTLFVDGDTRAHQPPN
ncbi:MAG: pilus assembly protein PilV [Rubrivivax sp.]